MRHFRFAFLTLILTAPLFFAATPDITRAAELPERPERPNIVLIISDDHAWTDYGLMGHPVVQTPNIDKLASEGLVYTRAYVPSSLCCPSLASIITGLYPQQHKITSNDPPIPEGMPAGDFYKSQAYEDGRAIMSRHMDAAPALPKLLGQNGYLSFQSGKWWAGDYKHGGFTSGMTRGGRHGDEGLAIGRETMQPIYDFIDTARKEDKPFFLWYAPMLPHDPHTPPDRLLQKYQGKGRSIFQEKYWAMVEWFDETCGELLDYLDAKNLSENTLVFYLADNGWISRDDSPRFDPRSKQSPYDGGLRTPLIVRWPGKVRPGRCKTPVSSIDIAPTILDALGIARDPQLQGVNLLDAAAVENRETIQGACFTHNAVDLENPAASLRFRWIIQGKWKLIDPDPREKLAAELFDIAADPEEKHDLSRSNPQEVLLLRQKLDRWWSPR